MLGSFEWHVKQENLRRFLTAADPVLAAAGVELAIGGRVPKQFQDEMAPLLKATRFIGWVDDVDQFLGGCRIGVIAEPLGGGFKLKSLDYIFHGVPIAAVRGSVAGLPLEPGVDTIEAADDAELARMIVDAIDDDGRLQALADRARERCRAAFAWPTRGRAIIDAVRTTSM